MKYTAAPSLLALALAAGLAGCDSIGDGSTIEKLEVVPVSFNAARPHVAYRCLRDQVIALATFSDGTLANFSERVHWSSSNPGIVTVSNGEIPFVIASGPGFINAPGIAYIGGTLIPGTTGNATVTATFASLSASIPVTVATATFGAAAAGIDETLTSVLRYVGPDLTQVFRLYVTEPTGRLGFPSSLNPIVWRFTTGAVSSDGLAHVAPSAESPAIEVRSSFDQGIVRGITAGETEYTVQARTSLCPDEPAFMPTATVKVAPATALTLHYERDFNGPGQNFGNVFGGTNTLFRTTATLNGGSAGPQVIDVSDQVDYNLVHQTACTSGETNCVCDSNNANCRVVVLGNSGRQVATILNNVTEDATFSSCFTLVDADHSDDCEEIAAGEATSLASNTLPLRVVPVDYTTGTLQVLPASATEKVFTYPGVQFESYATFPAQAGFTFLDGDADPLNNPTTGTQRVTRATAWSAYVDGSTTQVSPIVQMRTAFDGFLAEPGSVAYIAPVTANTAVDVYAAPVAPFNNLGTSAPADLTVTP